MAELLVPRLLVAPGSVLIGPDAARELSLLISEGLRVRRHVHGYQPSPVVADVVRALDAAQAYAPGSRAGSPVQPSGLAGRMWLSTGETAARLGLSRRRVTEMAARGVIEAERVAGVWRFAAADVAAEITART